jgi:ABC-type glycerol-3-phosphate transport system substrate-binding protein
MEKKLTRRDFLRAGGAVSAALFGGSLLSACGIGVGSGGGGSGGGGDRIGGEITFSTLQLKPTFTNYINGVIKDFENQHSGVKVNWIDVPFEGAQEKIVADASGGTLPDVINLNPGYAYPLATRGTFLNMDKEAADVKDEYVPGAWDAFKMPGVGHGIALPWYLTIDLTLYNKAYFRQAGLDPEEPPTTFPEFYADARQVARRTDHYGFAPALENRFLTDLAKLDVPIVSDDGKKAAFDTPEAVSYLENLVRLYKEKVMPPDSVGQDHRQEIDSYSAGQIALFPGGPNFLTIIRQNAPNIADQTGVGPQITGKRGETDMAVMGILVPESSDNRATAMAFAKFVTNGKNQIAFSKIVTIFPSILSALKDPYFTDVKGDKPEDVARKLSADQIPKARTLVSAVADDQFSNAVTDKAQAAILGQMSARQAISEAAQAATAVLQQGN